MNRMMTLLSSDQEMNQALMCSSKANMNAGVFMPPRYSLPVSAANAMPMVSPALCHPCAYDRTPVNIAAPAPYTNPSLLSCGEGMLGREGDMNSAAYLSMAVPGAPPAIFYVMAPAPAFHTGAFSTVPTAVRDATHGEEPRGFVFHPGVEVPRAGDGDGQPHLHLGAPHPSSFGKSATVNVNTVCRHFLSGRCNRRKCRFRHVCDPSAQGAFNPFLSMCGVGMETAHTRVSSPAAGNSAASTISTLNLTTGSFNASTPREGGEGLTATSSTVNSFANTEGSPVSSATPLTSWMPVNTPAIFINPSSPWANTPSTI